MLRLGRRVCVASAAASLAVGIHAVPASAATTRADYVAQVDPICQSYVGPLNAAFGAYTRSYKRLLRAARSGTLKAFVRATSRTARSLNGIADVHASLISQVAGVPPVPADAGTVGTWLGYLGQERDAERSAALALASFNFKRTNRKLRQADRALRSGQAAISGFGFQVCGVAVY